MKLLFDQNLSHKLTGLLKDVYPESLHVREVGLKTADDSSVWDYAKANGLIIVSKDSDFHQRSFLFGPPPKVIWIDMGNCSTADVQRTLRKHGVEIDEFCRDIKAAFVVLS